MPPPLDGPVSREEFNRLVAMVEALSARLAPAPAPAEDGEQVAPEVGPDEIAIIAAAVTAFLGKPVRVRAARRIQPPPPPAQSPWGLQGRIFIQASHQLGARKGR